MRRRLWRWAYISWSIKPAARPSVGGGEQLGVFDNHPPARAKVSRQGGVAGERRGGGFLQPLSDTVILQTDTHRTYGFADTIHRKSRQSDPVTLVRAFHCVTRPSCPVPSHPSTLYPMYSQPFTTRVVLQMDAKKIWRLCPIGWHTVVTRGWNRTSNGEYS